MEVRKALRAMLARKEVILAPGAWDALTALIVESLGFKACYMGGWVTGAHLGITEPRTTLTEMVANAAWATKAIKIPLIVDADAGFGDPLHTMRCVKEFEFAGVSAIHIEDQLFPKRAHYHKGIKHTVPLEEMLEKLHAALEARTDPDFVIIARTDARGEVGGSLKETIRRCQAFAEAGVDAIQPFGARMPVEELKIVRREVPNVPIMGTGCPSRKEAEEIGVQIVIHPVGPILVATEAVTDFYREFMETGEITDTFSPRFQKIRTNIQELIGFTEYYGVEEATTEKRWQH